MNYHPTDRVASIAYEVFRDSAIQPLIDREIEIAKATDARVNRDSLNSMSAGIGTLLRTTVRREAFEEVRRMLDLVIAQAQGKEEAA